MIQPCDGNLCNCKATTFEEFVKGKCPHCLPGWLQATIEDSGNGDKDNPILIIFKDIEDSISLRGGKMILRLWTHLNPHVFPADIVGKYVTLGQTPCEVTSCLPVVGWAEGTAYELRITQGEPRYL